MRLIRNTIKFIKKHSYLNTIFVGFSLLFIWWGGWGILDFLFPDSIFAKIIFVLVGMILIFVDDFKFDELKNK